MNFDNQSLLQAVTYAAFHLTKALTAFLQRDSFLYWPYLVSAAAIALAVAWHARRSGVREEGAPHTWRERARSRWWHASARADYRLYLVNALLLPAVFGF